MSGSPFRPKKIGKHVFVECWATYKHTSLTLIDWGEILVPKLWSQNLTLVKILKTCLPIDRTSWLTLHLGSNLVRLTAKNILHPIRGPDEKAAMYHLALYEPVHRGMHHCTKIVSGGPVDDFLGS